MISEISLYSLSKPSGPYYMATYSLRQFLTPSILGRPLLVPILELHMIFIYP
jgi:hypothetical protein